jgi:hypothetical protein
VIQCLLDHGHPNALDYTLDQVSWWSAAIERKTASAHARAIFAARMAWADGKDVQRVLRALGGL